MCPDELHLNERKNDSRINLLLYKQETHLLFMTINIQMSIVVFKALRKKTTTLAIILITIQTLTNMKLTQLESHLQTFYKTPYLQQMAQDPQTLPWAHVCQTLFH